MKVQFQGKWYKTEANEVYASEHENGPWELVGAYGDEVGQIEMEGKHALKIVTAHEAYLYYNDGFYKLAN